MIRALGHRVVAGRLADVDDPHRGRQPVDDRARGEPVDDDDVGRGEQLVAACGEQAVGARAATDERDPAVGAACVRVRRRSRAPETSARSTPSRTVTARPGSPAAYAATVTPAVGGGHVGAGGDARGGAGGIGRVDAPDAQRLGVGGDLAVDGRLARRGVREPRAVEVGGAGVVARGPVDRPAAARSRRSSQSQGATTRTTAPSSRKARTLRADTGPPPTATTRRPVRSRTTGSADLPPSPRVFGGKLGGGAPRGFRSPIPRHPPARSARAPSWAASPRPCRPRRSDRRGRR